MALEALCTAFGTAGTGGFGIYNDSLTSCTPYVQNVTTVFMFLFGVNFSCYYLLLLAKSLRRNTKQLTNPNQVLVIRNNGKPVSETVASNTHAYLAAYVIIIIVSYLLISLDGHSIGTNFSAVLCCFNNIGPGMEAVGPTCNFGHLRGNIMKKPVVAICYDFDKTLSPDDMQAQGYIQSVGYNVADFWAESNKLAHEHEMDENLAYMYLMIQKAKGKVLFTRKTLQEYGSKVELFPGVTDWFDRITAYGLAHGVWVEHYIISSGLKEMIEGTAVSDKFKKVYASAFYYDSNGVAKWPAQAVNYTNKTQFLFRIQKGVLDINDHGVNDYVQPENIRVPFRNMVYIGDSATDIPCMRLVTTNGGHAIGVYNRDPSKVQKLLRDGRIRYYAPADYRADGQLDQLVKAIIDRTVTNEVLENAYYQCKKDEHGQMV